jgi:hypothetical protein
VQNQGDREQYGGDDGGDDVLLETVVPQGFPLQVSARRRIGNAMTSVSPERVPGTGRRRTGCDGSR